MHLLALVFNIDVAGLIFRSLLVAQLVEHVHSFAEKDLVDQLKRLVAQPALLLVRVDAI